MSALFISMAEIGDITGPVAESSEPVIGKADPNKAKVAFQSFIDSLSDEVEFWDYGDFHRELESADLPELPIRLLEHARLAWLLPNTDLAEETGIWDVLGKAVEKDNWQWPENSGAVKDKLEDDLRSK